MPLDDVEIIQLIALVVMCIAASGVGLLLFRLLKEWIRHRREMASWKLIERDYWAIPPIDTAPLLPRLQKLRENYVAETHSAPRPVNQQSDRVADARRNISSLAYFRDRADESEPESPAPETAV